MYMTVIKMIKIPCSQSLSSTPSLPDPALYVEQDPLDLELMLPQGERIAPVDDLTDCILMNVPDLSTIKSPRD